MDLGLTDRVFVLTGASRGLGFATAECLVADGARVVISGRDTARLDAAVQSRMAAQRSGEPLRHRFRGGRHFRSCGPRLARTDRAGGA